MSPSCGGRGRGEKRRKGKEEGAAEERGGAEGLVPCWGRGSFGGRQLRQSGGQSRVAAGSGKVPAASSGPAEGKGQQQAGCPPGGASSGALRPACESSPGTGDPTLRSQAPHIDAAQDAAGPGQGHPVPHHRTGPQEPGSAASSPRPPLCTPGPWDALLSPSPASLAVDTQGQELRKAKCEGHRPQPAQPQHLRQVATRGQHLSPEPRQGGSGVGRSPPASCGLLVAFGRGRASFPGGCAVVALCHGDMQAFTSRPLNPGRVLHGGAKGSPSRLPCATLTRAPRASGAQPWLEDGPPAHACRHPVLVPGRAGPQGGQAPDPAPAHGRGRCQGGWTSALTPALGGRRCLGSSAAGHV